MIVHNYDIDNSINSCHVQLYVPGAVYRRILEILKKAESSLIDYSYMV